MASSSCQDGEHTSIMTMPITGSCRVQRARLATTSHYARHITLINPLLPQFFPVSQNFGQFLFGAYARVSSTSLQLQGAHNISTWAGPSNHLQFLHES